MINSRIQDSIFFCLMIDIYHFPIEWTVASILATVVTFKIFLNERFEFKWKLFQDTNFHELFVSAAKIEVWSTRCSFRNSI